MSKITQQIIGNINEGSYLGKAGEDRTVLFDIVEIEPVTHVAHQHKGESTSTDAIRLTFSNSKSTYMSHPMVVTKEVLAKICAAQTQSAAPASQDSLRSLQAELKRLDPNGWETLEDDEQSDVEVLKAAIDDIKKNA